jgi:hypothetical protein
VQIPIIATLVVFRLPAPRKRSKQRVTGLLKGAFSVIASACIDGTPIFGAAACFGLGVS